jgi:hypothetical protein
VSCAIFNNQAAVGSPRVSVSCCKTFQGAAVTAEVASSSLVVPAIHSLFPTAHKAVERISLKPTRVLKGAFLHPFCTPFCQLEAFSHIAPIHDLAAYTGAAQFISDAKSRSSTAACAARLAGEIACV